MSPKKAIPTPNMPHAKFTQSLSSHFQPRMWTVSVPQVWRGCFSVSFWSAGQKYIACTVAPRKESKREPARPAIVISTKWTVVSVLRGENKTAGSAIMAEPAREASVPNNEIPPDVPFSTRLRKTVIMRGGVGFRTPNSVAHVSALTAASEAANPIQGRIDSG